jgi:hypothetical protein
MIMRLYLKKNIFNIAWLSLSGLTLISCAAKEYKLSITSKPPVANFSSRSMNYIGGATSITITSTPEIDKNFPKFKAILEASILKNDIQVYAKSPETDTLALHLQLNHLLMVPANETSSENEFSNRYFYAHQDSKAFSETSSFEYFGIYSKNENYFTVAVPSSIYYLDASLFSSNKELLAKTIIKVLSLSCLKETFITTLRVTSSKDMQISPHWSSLEKQDLDIQSLKCLASHAALSIKEKRPQIFRAID